MASPSLDQILIASAALISHLQDTLTNTSSQEQPASSKPINPLALSSTAAALIKAQTTKLTLLALNKPFTPSSIIQILNTISASPLPALITAVQQCDPVRFSRFARYELQSRVSRLLQVYKTLLEQIPTSTKAQESSISISRAGNSRNGNAIDQKAALMGTGLVWEVCDEIIAFSEQGLGTMASKKMTSYRGLFNDGLEEINDWLEEGRDSSHLEDSMDAMNVDDTSSDSTSIGSFSPHPTAETIPVAEWTLNILHHIALLYPPLLKRRILIFPECNGKTPLEAVPMQAIPKLDLLLDACKSWSEQIDLIAEALYENQTESAMERVDTLVGSTREPIEVAKAAWDGSEDKFSAWIDQWTKKMSEVKTKARPPT